MAANLWNTLLLQLPHPHFLQSWEWGQVKAAYGWQPYHLIWEGPSGKTRMHLFEGSSPQTDDPSHNGTSIHAAALVLVRTLSIGPLRTPLRVAYAPKGPVVDWDNQERCRQVLRDLGDFARAKGALFIKIDPDVRLGTGLPGEPESRENPTGQQWLTELRENGWQISQEQIQFRNTIVIDLTAPEEEILARMKQKTRYNIRLAARKGVHVRAGSVDDLDLLAHMYAETSARDGFVIREKSYYLTVWKTFLDAGLAEPLIAEVEGEPVGAVIIFRFGGQAWYLYGMSRALHRNKMPNYLLQWEAMRRARQAGCRGYDLWGAPDDFTEDDPMWGVFRFKQGLGGTVVRHIGAWDLPLHPRAYRLYTQTLPRLLAVMRRRGVNRTRRMLSE